MIPIILILAILDLIIVGFIRFSAADNVLEKILSSFNQEFIILVISVTFFAGILMHLSLEKFEPKNFCILNRSEKLCLKPKLLSEIDCFQKSDFDNWFKRT